MVRKIWKLKSFGVLEICSNVVAATDLTLLALAGLGLRHKKVLLCPLSLSLCLSSIFVSVSFQFSELKNSCFFLSIPPIIQLLTKLSLVELLLSIYTVHQKLGFASCARSSGATEGINVLIEKKSSNGHWEYGISCIEYTEFEKYGIIDSSISHRR